MADERYPEPPFPKPKEQSPPGSEAELEPRPQYQAPEYRAAAKLEGKVALVTGGDSGIGRAVAFMFAKEGADVALVYLPEEQEDADETKQMVERCGRQALMFAGDVAEPEFCQTVVSETVQSYGHLDILVNNAAFQKHRAAIEEVSIEQWKHTFNVNIDGYFYLAKAAIPHFEAGACIINTGSIVGLEGRKGLLDYSATKGAIHAFTKSLAQQMIERGIRVNCVAPGPVWTPLNPAERDEDEMVEFGAGTPLGRPAQPEEIAPAFVFFASNADSGYVSGEVLTLLGGDTRAG